MNERKFDLFEQIRDSLLMLDPVYFCQKYLTLDGKPFRIEGNGYKPFADIYRYIGVKALEKNSLPVAVVKGRQIGMSTLASCLELYFMACGFFGIPGHPPIRIMHCFPQLELAYAYTKTKLNTMITTSVNPDKINPSVKKAGRHKSYLELKLDTATAANDSLQFKQFENGNHIWIESTGLDGNRLRGRQLCLETELPTPNGFVKLKNLKEGDQLFDENGKICNVIKIHPVNLTPEAYRVTFDDGTIVDACAEHLWPTYNKYEQNKKLSFKIRSTKEIFNSLKVKDNHAIDNCLAVEYSEKELYKIKINSISTRRFIKSIESIESKPMRCITVDSPSHLYLITKSFIPTHNTVDAVFFDEIQDIRGEALGNVTKSLAKSQYGKVGEGIQVFFGTPKRKGSEFWKIWNQSSQQYYYLGCSKCNGHFPLYTPSSNDWEKVWIEDTLPKTHPDHGFIVKCIHCGHEQDKRIAAEKGKWVPFNKNPEVKFVGFHMNQLYMPEFTRAKIIGEKPENHPINTERVFQTEVLGEFYSGDSSPITVEEIDAVAADRGRKFRAKITTSDNKRVYLGCDWGQKVDSDALQIGDKKRQQGQSYSCSVVLVADGPHILSIDFATRLKRNDLESKKGIVEQMFRQYSVNLAVGDIGYANDLTEILQKEYGDKFLASQAASRVNGHVKYKTDFFPNTIVFERDYYIAEVYSMIKEGKIRFPYGDYEKVSWLIDHICSMEIKPVKDRSGDTGIRYVKGATPNDGMMALVNAYLAYKFDISGGFTINNPNLMLKDPTEHRQIPAIAGYIPRMNPFKR